MILQASLIGGWEKLELWDHTHLALFALLIMVCVLEVILLKITTSADLLGRPHHYDPDYDDSGEYEEDIYYEDLSANYNHRSRQQMHYYNRQQEHQIRYSYPYSSDENNFLFDNTNNYHSTSTDLFRFVY